MSDYKLFAFGIMIVTACGGGSATHVDARGSGTVMCFDVAMSGSDQICDAATSDNPSFTCPPQLQVGSCPSAGLIGCCIIATPNAEFTTFNAGCYYDTTMATAAQSACTGSNESWQTTAP